MGSRRSRKVNEGSRVRPLILSRCIGGVGRGGEEMGSEQGRWGVSKGDGGGCGIVRDCACASCVSKLVFRSFCRTCFKRVSNVCLTCFKRVSKRLSSCVKIHEYLHGFQQRHKRCFKRVSSVFQTCVEAKYMVFSKDTQGATNSGHKEPRTRVKMRHPHGLQQRHTRRQGCHFMLKAFTIRFITLLI
jgi:hypothetical protein